MPLTLRKLFALGLLGMVAGLCLLFYLIGDESERTLLQSAEQFRMAASEEVARRVANYLGKAPNAIADFEQQEQCGLIDLSDPRSIQAGLLNLLLANVQITEASFTSGEGRGYGPDGNLDIAPSTVRQAAVFRNPPESSAPGTPRFFARQARWKGNGFVSQVRTLDERTRAWNLSAEVPAADPSGTPYFREAAARGAAGRLLWSDLSWCASDAGLPEERRRIEVSVQKAVAGTDGRFLGVLRIGLLNNQVTRPIHFHIGTANTDAADPHLIFLCDASGRLITGFGPDNRIADSGGKLRIVSGTLPPEVARALRQPALGTVNADHPLAATGFRIGPASYLCTFRALAERRDDLPAPDWIVGVVVPRDYYLGPLKRMRQEFLWASFGVIVLVITIGGFTLRSIARAHSMISDETDRMNRFQFLPSRNASPLRDVAAVLAGLEKAKTAMRAMGKYVPVDLMRRLYRDGREPVLGGESADLSVLFTDIQDFTSFSEEIPADRMAAILGRYLETVTTVIQEERGTIDKYIGDAVMAFWNAPEPVPDHAILACRAALRCRAALQRLYASPEWEGFPRFETRFGLHRCVASLGHFGAPSRFNYTAIGDGINLASRLEGLNKHYGTTIIVSETVHEAAREAFEFRLLDRVAVKGKARGVTVYEPLFEKEAGALRPAAIENYEAAFALYQRGDFPAALSLAGAEPGDAPSRVLAERCRHLVANPPPAPWTGIHVLQAK